MRKRYTLLRDYGRPGGSFLLAILLALAGCAGNEQRALDLAAQAQAEADAGQIAQARKTIGKAIRERDDLAQLYIEKGRIEIAAKSYQEAFAAYSEASSLDATSFEALQAIARLGILLGYAKEARDATERLLILQPADPDALMVAGLLALDRRQGDEAAAFAQRILQRNPADERGLVLKARTQFFRGDSAGAVATLKNGAGSPGEATCLTLLELYRARSDAAGMLEQFACLRVSRSADLRLRVDEANFRYKIGDMTKARAIMQDVMSGSDVSADIVGHARTMWQAYDPAVYEGANPPRFRDANARRAVARFVLANGQPRRASDILGVAKSVADKALSARIAVADGSAVGMSAAMQILDRDNTQCDALLASAAALTRGGDPARAVTAAQRAVAECPDDPGGYLQLAASNRAGLNQPGEFRALDAGLAAHPQDVQIASTYYARAVQGGDTERALSVARRFTRGAPSLTAAWAMLTKACKLTKDDACAQRAKVGLDKARSDYRLDPLPGELPAGGALGQLRQ